AAEDGFVADDDSVDVTVAFGEIDHRMDFAVVTILILVDPGAGRDTQSEFGRDAGHEFSPAGRRIRTNGARERRQHLEIGANLRNARPGSGIRMRRTFK